MATESTTITTPCTLIEELIERSRLSWLQVTVAVGLALILLLVGAMYLDGLLTGPFDVPLWRVLMMYPAIIVYLLSIQPTVRRLRNSAIRAFRPLVPTSDEDYRQLVAEAPLFNRRRQWLALGIGAVTGVVLWPPWEYYSLGLALYAGLVGALGLGLTGWFIYVALAGTRLFTKCQRRPLDITIFDLKPLEAIGRWSLGIALALIAGTTLSVLLSAPRFTIRLETIIIYIPLILAPVLVFFLNMLSTHRVMAEAKERQLRLVRDSLEASSRALEERVAGGEIEDVAALLDSFSAWVTVENRVKAAPEWPYTQSIMRSLAASTLLPIAVFILEGALLQLLIRSMALGE